jgi:hypothetical protein
LRATAVVHFGFNKQREQSLFGPIINDVALVYIACAGQFRSAWANIDIAILVEDKVGTAEGAISAFGFVPNRNVRCDVAIYKPFEQLGRAIDRVACEPLGPRRLREDRSQRRTAYGSARPHAT